ncbi:HD domain-containing protein [Geobacter benzoatilyticus]|uniref:HD domain-containing protein n=1 Tax=Geobacter benzoatilyticus TaxID=2815309 RepID=A0ABX7Q8W8_9BACT|nr:HD domain-containing protein [Geobacter benzoatilyticus]QSV47430.1 HD domain-containing protein [Geobacter benzoatilyticus]
MNVEQIMARHFGDAAEACAIVLEHSRLVADKAVRIARNLSDPSLDVAFIEEAALLHDIGVCRTNSPGIGCTGSAPYILHGIIGREILESEGLPLHALVCERHIGVGLTIEDIKHQSLPLPSRDMVPISREEKLVCYADLFFSKKRDTLRKEKSPQEIREGLRKHGEHRVAIFEEWLVEFGA